MPELPEVQTTVVGLRSKVVGLTIRDVWSNYNSKYYTGRDTIKDPAYFRKFKMQVIGKNILSVERRAKNILINISGDKTILAHMKMTGHFLYGKYRFDENQPNDPWTPISPESLKDPYNRRIRFVIRLSNGCFLALSDTRRFAKITLIETSTAHASVHLAGVGPEPLDDTFDFEKFDERLNLKKSARIKLVLLDQNIIAGIGNIYADESLWRAGIDPRKIVSKIDRKSRLSLFKAIKKTLSSGINFGGDSMSDYRNIDGERGKFQNEHMAYQRTGERCKKTGCKGHIMRIVLGGRGTHLCDTHQR